MAKVTETDRDFKRLPSLISKGHSSNYVTHWFISPEANTPTKASTTHKHTLPQTRILTYTHTYTHRVGINLLPTPNYYCFLWKSCDWLRSLRSGPQGWGCVFFSICSGSIPHPDSPVHSSHKNPVTHSSLSPALLRVTLCLLTVYVTLTERLRQGVPSFQITNSLDEHVRVRQFHDRCLRCVSDRLMWSHVDAELN